MRCLVYFSSILYWAGEGFPFSYSNISNVCVFFLYFPNLPFCWMCSFFQSKNVLYTGPGVSLLFLAARSINEIFLEIEGANEQIRGVNALDGIS